MRLPLCQIAICCLWRDYMSLWGLLVCVCETKQQLKSATTETREGPWGGSWHYEVQTPVPSKGQDGDAEEATCWSGSWGLPWTEKCPHCLVPAELPRHRNMDRELQTSKFSDKPEACFSICNLPILEFDPLKKNCLKPLIQLEGFRFVISSWQKANGFEYLYPLPRNLNSDFTCWWLWANYLTCLNFRFLTFHNTNIYFPTNKHLMELDILKACANLAGQRWGSWDDSGEKGRRMEGSLQHTWDKERSRLLSVGRDRQTDIHTKANTNSIKINCTLRRIG